AQGRLLLPEKLRKLANMDKKIVLVGQLARFEIWQEETWDAKENEWLQTESADDLRELGDLNF
ncbi:MAG: division/cell wall cluster transcriptional repressor MraZ, partial [Methylomonas sp.]